MMKKKLTTNDILNSLSFSQKEKEIFSECIKKVKEEQKNDLIDAEKEMEKIIEGVVKDEI